jgi:hypothetical protein
MSPPALIPMQVQSLAPPAERLVLHGSQGYRLELLSTVDAAWLAELLRCLA